jgi:2-polyprenyl-3-methyl-5-hydroxy-6-metoxy-1,4-benzoquinol methylase
MRYRARVVKAFGIRPAPPTYRTSYQLHRDPRSSHQRIARYVKALGRDPILDVGASNGQIGQLLAGSDLTIDAVEPHAASADNAAPYYRTVYSSSVEEVELPREHYRVLICADILEHTIDPVRAIGRLLEAATDDVRLVISLPNVGHLAARAIVLAGKFPQEDRGIFDRTHLHFYTRDTMMALMADAGLKVEHLGATPVPLEEVWPPQLPTGLRDIGMDLQTAAIRLAPRLFAYQWLVVATRR